MKNKTVKFHSENQVNVKYQLSNGLSISPRIFYFVNVFISTLVLFNDAYLKMSIIHPIPKVENLSIVSRNGFFSV